MGQLEFQIVTLVKAVSYLLRLVYDCECVENVVYPPVSAGIECVCDMRLLTKDKV